MKLPKMVVLVVKRYAVREAEIGRHAVRKGVSPACLWIVVHVLSLEGLGFHIKYIVTKVRNSE